VLKIAVRNIRNTSEEEKCVEVALCTCTAAFMHGFLAAQKKA